MIACNEAINSVAMRRFLEDSPLPYSTLAQMLIDGRKYGQAAYSIDESGNIRSISPEEYLDYSHTLQQDTILEELVSGLTGLDTPEVE